MHKVYKSNIYKPCPKILERFNSQIKQNSKILNKRKKQKLDEEEEIRMQK